MNRQLVRGAAVLTIALLCGTAMAQNPVPTKLNFTARLVDNGAPVNGNRDFVFKLFPTLVGGTETWLETRNSVSVVDGLVNVDLGASTALTDSTFDGQTMYLEVTINGTTLAPRTAVLSVPYALRSTVAGRVGTLTETDIQRRVSNGCGTGTAIRSINADGTVSCQASAVNVTDAGVVGISSINGGAGLTGGGAVGDLTLAVNFAGSGTANTVARSDHTHAGAYLPKGPLLACAGTNKVQSIDSVSGSVVCAPDIDTNSGGTVTSVAVGTGLTGGPITTSGTIGLASTVQNWSSQPTCAPGVRFGRSLRAERQRARRSRSPR